MGERRWSAADIRDAARSIGGPVVRLIADRLLKALEDRAAGG